MPIPRNHVREAEIQRLYTEDGFSTVQIAVLLGMTREGVRQCLIRMGVTRRPADWTCTEINYGQRSA